MRNKVDIGLDLFWDVSSTSTIPLLLDSGIDFSKNTNSSKVSLSLSSRIIKSIRI